LVMAALGGLLACGVRFGLADGWLAVRTPHFVVFSQGGGDLAYEVALVAEDSLPHLAARLGVKPPTTSKLKVYASIRAFYKALGATYETTHVLLGAASGEEHTVYLLAAGGVAPAKSTIRHELVHLLVFAAASPHADEVPLWFNEGLAVYFSGGLPPDVGGNPAMSVAPANLLPPEQLREHFPPDQPELSLAYAESRSLVAYWRKRFGATSFSKCLEFIKEGKPFEEAFREATGAELQEFFADWRASLGRSAWSRYLPSVLTSLVFFVMAALVVVTYLRRRRALARVVEQEESDAFEEWPWEE